MGRKKKEEQIKVETTTPTVVYRGGATVKVVRNGKVVRQINKHNVGGTPLFSFLADCMAGNFYPNNRPTCIVVGYKDTDAQENQWNPYSLAYIVASSSSVSADGTTVNISFTVPGGLINTSFIQNDTPLNCLRIYSVSNAGAGKWTNQGDYSAEIILNGSAGTDTAPITSLTTDDSLLIVWSMNVSNVAIESSNQGE